MKYDSQDIANLISSTNIVKVIEELTGQDGKRKGRDVLFVCPFHNDHSPSLSVNEAKGVFVCRVCGKGGNVVDFVKEFMHCEFLEAIEKIASIMHQELTPIGDIDPKTRETNRLKAAVISCNEMAAKFYREQLMLPENEHVLKYVRERWSDEDIDMWDIGYAPSDTKLLFNTLFKQGASAEALTKSDLFKDGNAAQKECFYRERIIFPIRNNTNQIVGFTGRILPWNDSGDTAKYKNSRTNTDLPIFEKSKVLYGWSFAKKTIRDTNEVLIVEGNPDVIRMHSIGVTNAVATCGTALSMQHVAMIGKECKRVTLMFDPDKAGKDATMRAGKAFMGAGITPYVLPLPQDGNGVKQDPDQFFTSAEQFKQYAFDNKKHFVMYYAELRKPNTDDETEISRYMVDVAKFLAMMPETEWMGYVSRLARIIGEKARWMAAVRAETVAVLKLDTEGFTESQQEMKEKYGFYEKNNSYYVLRGVKESYGEQVSNFVMQPLFHIASTNRAKRIYRLKNVAGLTKDIEISQKDLCSKAAFCACVESVGNYLFVGSEKDLAKIKGYLYDNTLSCSPIEQMGWQKTEQFWAWSNGITTKDGNFIPNNDLGIIQYNNQYYFMPALSSIYASDTDLYQYERRYHHQDSDADLFVWGDKFVKTFGENAKIGICYYIASLFRDVAFNRLASFPILNVFGQPGSGKTKFILSLIRMFGDHVSGSNIANTSPAAMGDELASTCNGLMHFDEFKNSLITEKIELLKGNYDGRGRNRMAMDRDGKRAKTKSDSALILSGQEMTTVDEALFERTIFLEFSADPKVHALTAADFDDLRRYEDGRSLTPITNKILAHRSYVEEHYFEHYDKVKQELQVKLQAMNVKVRNLETYSIILSFIEMLAPKIALPFTYEDAYGVFWRRLLRQKDEQAATDPMAKWWNGVHTLLFRGDIAVGYDLHIRAKSDFTLEKGTKSDKHKVHYPDRKNCLILNPADVFALYEKLCATGAKNGDNHVQIESLKAYIKSQPYFLGEFVTTFRRRVGKQEDQFQHMGDGTIGRKVEPMKIRAWVFDYDVIQEEYEISLEVGNSINENE